MGLHYIFKEKCMDKQKVYDECMAHAKEFVKPYLIKNVCELDKYGTIVLSYMANYIPIDYHYDVYEDLYRFIALAVNGRHNGIMLWEIKGQPRNPKLCSQLLSPLNTCKDPKDYQHIVNIIFCMIRHKIYSKNDFVDALKDTTNIPSLMEIIKYDDFTVMTDNHRFDV